VLNPPIASLIPSVQIPTSNLCLPCWPALKYGIFI